MLSAWAICWFVLGVDAGVLLCIAIDRMIAKPSRGVNATRGATADS
jgi:hypothetical protein